MKQTMRWFGPGDPVSLAAIRQAGCSGVVTALHQFAPGETWPVTAIRERKKMIEDAGMEWTVVESLPVHEDIKKRDGDFRLYIENYKESIRNLAACGLEVITYNFMPILDWMRTDISYTLPDGSKALYFEKAAFVAFDLFLLQRPGAGKDYSSEEIAAAVSRFELMTAAEKEKLFKNALLSLPGTDTPFTPGEVLTALRTYDGIDAAGLKQRLFAFLREIVPAAEAAGMKLAIHPDDPPWPILGLPRIMSTAKDVADLLSAVPSTVNGLCFCTGSFGARSDNDLPAMVKSFADHIHFIHLRNTRRDALGNFYEAGHLAGDTDMYAVVKALLEVMKKRNTAIPMRPDHGHQLMDDLHKTTYPGYSAIGRLKGLAELRGLETGIKRSMEQNDAGKDAGTSLSADI